MKKVEGSKQNTASGENRRKPKEQLYLNALINVYKKSWEAKNFTVGDIKKIVLYSVKYVNTQRSNEFDTAEDAENFYSFVMATHKLIGLLSPNQFMNVFPIAKEYDGHKWEMKDYFYTRDYLNTLEKDKPIKDQNVDDGSVLAFLWEYHNWEVRRFTVALTTSLSQLQRLQGQPAITDDLFNTLGLETHTFYENNGKQFLLDANGRTTALHKPLPKYLKQLK